MLNHFFNNMVFLGNKRNLICLFPSFCLFHQFKVMVDRNMPPYSELMYAVWCRRYPPFAYLHLSGSKSAASSFGSIFQNRRSQQCWRSRMAPPPCHSKRTSFPQHSGTIAKATWAHCRGNGATVIVGHLSLLKHTRVTLLGSSQVVSKSSFGGTKSRNMHYCVVLFNLCSQQIYILIPD